MKEAGKESSPFVVSRQKEAVDLLDWAARNVRLIGEDLEVLATEVPLPYGGQIALLCAGAEGEIIVGDILDDEKETVHRLGRVLSFLRRREEWVAAAFPERTIRRGAEPKLLLLGGSFPPSLAEALEGLSFAEVRMVRIRDLESSDGRRLLLVEREGMEEERRPAAFPEALLTTEEEDFFHRMEEEKRALQSLEKTG